MKIVLHLLDDQHPTGPRIAKVDQWSGRAMCVPRSSTAELQQWKDLNGPCLYFLIAQPAAASAPRVYVGEADGFLSRLKSHVANKPWWTALVIFYSGDGSLTKSGIQYLESRAVHLLRKAGWCQLDNGTDPSLPTVPQEDIGGLDSFLRYVTIVMPVLGYNLFAEAPADEAEADDSAVETTASADPLDTIVCPARPEGFESAFLGQHAWWAIRIGAVNLPKIRYLAIYRVAPISAITHYGEVARIEVHADDKVAARKYKLFLKGDPIELPNPIRLGTHVNLKPQSPKYARLGDILQATTLDDVFG